MQQFDAQREQQAKAEAAVATGTTSNQAGQGNNTNVQAQANTGINGNVGSLNKDQIVEMIDETVEKIIDEKWNELVGSVNKIGKWKDKTESVIEMLKEDIVAMRDGFSKLETKIVNKISNYDRDIMDVGGEIKALEKVFQKITPTLINNVNELSKNRK